MNLKKFTLKEQTSKLDLPLAVTALGLVIFGLLMVYDSSIIQGLKRFDDSYYYIRQQLTWVGLGMLSLVFFSQFNYKKFKAFALPLLAISVVLMLAVFIPGFGVSGGGAHRWLGIGPITVQPAEIIKLTGVIFLAAIYEKGVRILPFIFLIGTVSIITAIFQKDLGSTIVFVATALLIYFASGAPIWQVIIGLPLGILTAVALIFTSGYRVKRVLAFLDPFSDTQGFTYHISQVLIALGAGGLFGLGLGNSRQKFEYIPEVTTDSIFAIIGEEMGLVGGIIVIALFIFLVTRGFKIAQNCRDNFGRILAIGLTSWIGIQTVINLSAMTALLPLTGVPLPFISYGGSALVANLTAVGILLNLSKQSSV